MLKKCNYGLIGSGMMGQEHIRNIALFEHADVLAFFEPDPEMAAASKSLVPKAVRVESIADLLKVPGLDCLLISSPNFLHAQQLKQIS